MDFLRRYDVLVVGGGNAGLAAAITARHAGATVLVLEAAVKDFRGGNSRHTRNLRCMHDNATDVLTESYPEAEYWKDLLRVTGGRTNEQLAQMVIRLSGTCPAWMKQQGVRFQRSLAGTLHLSATNAFFLGGGKSLLNAYYRTAAAIGIEVEYDAEVCALNMQDGKFVSAIVRRNGSNHEVYAKTLVAAAGGFQANIAWLKEAWGEVAENFIIRGTPYNKGQLLRMLVDHGARTIGDATQCHAVAVDARSPRFDGGIVTRVDCLPLGITVNKHAVRFYDEGEDLWPKRYAIWGRLVAKQPDQIAFTIIDSKSMGTFVPPMYPPIHAASIRDLAVALKLDPATLEKTVAEYNAAVQPGKFDRGILDECSTANLTPPKTHWARRLDVPPFYAYPLRPGITFTYLGCAVNERAEVILQDDKPAKNIFAAGEIMAGNILGQGYLAGIGMTIGTTFGRIAGLEASRYALS